MVLYVLFFVTEWLNEIPLMDLHDKLAVVSIPLRVFPASSRTQGFQDELDELLP